MTYKLPGTIKRDNHILDKVYRWTKREAIRYLLVHNDIEYSTPNVFRCEPTGELARCVILNGVPRILNRYHDCHCHFAKDMALRILQGRYFWPIRSKNVAAYCMSCDAC